MKNDSPGGSETRKPGYYWVCYHHSTDWFIAQWLGTNWCVADEDGRPDYYKDYDFDFIDERPIVRAAADTEQKKDIGVISWRIQELENEKARLKLALEMISENLSAIKDQCPYSHSVINHIINDVLLP
jgi:hypothetical protein